MTETFAIVGAGQAGSWIAKTLRSEGFDGRILLIGSEPHYPYERPPLSKSLLSGAGQLESATLLNRDEVQALRIDAVLGETVLSVDRTAKILICNSGRHIAYDRLFLTTGAVPRRLVQAPRQNSSRLHALRTADDAWGLAQALSGCGRLVIMGGGWIGLEVAATAREKGLEVVVIEAAERLCARSVPPIVSDYLADLHRNHDVDIRMGCVVRWIEEDDASVTVELSGGERVIADHLLIGIGAAPATELAESCGLAVDDGIIVDASGHTSDPSIFAAGDVTRQPCRYAGGMVRRESWVNAQNQAIVAAKAALGQAVSHNEVPWLWSDQYGRNIQILGYPERGVTCVARGKPATGSGCWLFLDPHRKPTGAIAIDAARDLRPVRKAIEADKSLDITQWADASIKLQSLTLI